MSSQRSLDSALFAMRSEWEARARKNARHYICTDVPQDEGMFYASGVEDYARHVRPFLADQRFDPRGKTALEIGCGVGRMTAAFAEEFEEVVGIDVSREMVEMARSRGLHGARFLLGSGCDLKGVETRSADFVFSYIVFQHIPEKAAILRYLEEAGRVLRPGGIFRFHMNGLPHVELGPVLLEAYLSISPRIPKLLHGKIPLVRRRHLDTWWGHPVSLRDIRGICSQSGLEITEVQGRWTPEMWVGGRKRVELA